MMRNTFTAVLDPAEPGLATSPQVAAIGWAGASLESMGEGADTWLQKIYSYTVTELQAGLAAGRDPTSGGPNLTLMHRPEGGQVSTQDLNLTALSVDLRPGAAGALLDQVVQALLPQLRASDYLVVVCPVSLYAPPPAGPHHATGATGIAAPSGVRGGKAAVSVTVIRRGCQVHGLSLVLRDSEGTRLLPGLPTMDQVLTLSPPSTLQ